VTRDDVEAVIWEQARGLTSWQPVIRAASITLVMQAIDTYNDDQIAKAATMTSSSTGHSHGSTR
jgi:hypothetical protein